MPSIDNAQQPFNEQIEFHRNKLKKLIPTKRWDDVWQTAHDHGVMVAGAHKADLLADLANAITGFIEDGHPIDKFRKDFDKTVAKHGWDYRGERNWRTRTIYRTNMATSYSAGRLAQLRDPELHKLAPYWMYLHTDGVENPRLHHLAWDKTTLPADDAWFKTHYTPNGWGCQCRITAVSKRQAEGDSGVFKRPTKPDDTEGIDDGWAYMPGDSFSPGFGRNKVAGLPVELAISLAQTINNHLPQEMGFWGQRPGLSQLPHLPITVILDTGFGSPTKRQLQKKADELLRDLQSSDGLANIDTGWNLLVNQKSRKKMGKNPQLAISESKAVSAIEALSLRAVAVERHRDLTHNNPDVTAIIRLFAPLQINKEGYLVKLTVKERTDGKKILHAIDTVEINHAPPGIFPSYSSDTSLQTDQPTTGRTVSIAQLVEGISLSDGKMIDLDRE